jgi:hypothetical protein
VSDEVPKARAASDDRRPAAKDGRPAANNGRPAAKDGRVVEKPQPAPRLCDLCRGPLLERHCKVLCLNCGYQRDCSDP